VTVRPLNDLSGTPECDRAMSSVALESAREVDLPWLGGPSPALARSLGVHVLSFSGRILLFGDELWCESRIVDPSRRRADERRIGFERMRTATVYGIVPIPSDRG
jgi:hypothetical protein